MILGISGSLEIEIYDPKTKLDISIEEEKEIIQGLKDGKFMLGLETKSIYHVKTNVKVYSFIYTILEGTEYNYD